MLLRLRLPAEVRRLKATPILYAHNSLGSNTSLLASGTLILNISKKVPKKYAKLLHILRLLVQEVLKKQIQFLKNNHNILKTKQKRKWHMS